MCPIGDCFSSWSLSLHLDDVGVSRPAFPSLGLHDSLIVRIEDQELPAMTLSKAYNDICHITPRIKVVSSTLPFRTKPPKV
jgi:hypothetical protein